MDENLENVVVPAEEELEVSEVLEEELEETVSAEELLSESVSGGDSSGVPVDGSVGDSSLSVEDIVNAIDLNGTEVYVIQEHTLWNKPLEEYSVTEGLLLIIALCLALGFFQGRCCRLSV